MIIKHHSMRPLQSLSIGLVIAFVAKASGAGAEPLPGFNVDAAGISVSGISSGGYMAGQFAIAHSEIIAGVGIFAGGPYRCAEGSVAQALGVCMQGVPELESVIAETESAAAAGRIDATENLGRQRIWLFSGYNDGVVKQPVMDRLRDYYLQFAPPSLVYYQDSLEAGHGIITLNYGGECPATGGEFINDCDFDGAGLLLQHIYGRLTPPTEQGLDGEFISFDQAAFVRGDILASGMAREGIVYVPDTCAAGEPCRVHIAFHGCRQNADEVGDAFYRHAGYNRWAASNNIIVLYPQTAASSLGPFNPKACWDWWGYTGADYAFKDGVQIAAVYAMLLQLGKGADSATPANPETERATDPALVATDASATAISLAWRSVSSAAAYHVSRAASATGPFSRVDTLAENQSSFADHGLDPRTTYYYRIQPATGGSPSDTVAMTTRAEAPPCDPYFSDNVTHTTQNRATALFGLTFAKGSLDYMGLWNVFTETALYREGGGYQRGICP